ncbi:hypothetical protein CROQUDRAFT_91753 [Cronartium quercuum f. sp. fusiforme G11]|uniref:Uncharacterized protein n=1 Tax=Cronartium quercuum f. sp. fusiforme G11 TaxID=708437 RepID=A0A9P6TC97_9BASI|nr:hypothetical protein CROQUDRAFT_91753 [Cronartium quercuum f. sp. fusiforme G11]
MLEAGRLGCPHRSVTSRDVTRLRHSDTLDSSRSVSVVFPLTDRPEKLTVHLTFRITSLPLLNLDPIAYRSDHSHPSDQTVRNLNDPIFKRSDPNQFY